MKWSHFHENVRYVANSVAYLMFTPETNIPLIYQHVGILVSGLLASNVSQCTSTTDSQEHALNCTVHKILLTVFTINQLIPLLSDSYSNILLKPIVFFD